MRVVITGPPHSGKTTLLAELARRGHRAVRESALEVIDALSALCGVDGQGEWRRAWAGAFQELVGRRQLRLEAEVERERGLVFLDRSVVDGVAYSAINGVECPPLVLGAAGRARYDRVFLLDLILPYAAREGTGRTTDEARARATHGLLLDAYRRLGHDPVVVPMAAVEARAELVLGALGSAYGLSGSG